ncbi:protocadherin-11 X-linked [Aplysia californica]|uniref:Protocadherin-11 X-linked n=1 Tax=Aplysia californica TaxID=6500 RepID=A0ABM1A2V0_APLCA|nr:protocadherin-11 X-linked [Aplysia californica]
MTSQNIVDAFVTSCAILVTMTTMSVHAQTMQLNYTVEEERPAMTRLGNVLQDSNILDFVDPADVQDLRFSFLTEGNPDANFLWINSTSGQLRTFSRINRELVCPRQLTCNLNVQTAVQMQLGAFFMLVNVRVTVLDVNDHTPTFDPNVFVLTIPEDESTGSVYRLPTAVDPDTGPGNSVVDYNPIGMSGLPFTLIVTGTDPSNFALKLRLDVNLDRETSPEYEMFVEAVDGGSPSKTGTLTLTVVVGDVNDNLPIFDRAEYALNISESTPVGSVLTTVRATDRDVGENGALTYAMPATQDDQVVFSLFSVNATSGNVQTLIPLDTYAGRTYRVTVEARDGGVTPGSATTEVVISVLDTHNSDPEILLNVFGIDGMAQVSEKAELGRAVAHVAVSDPDSRHSPNGRVSCELDSQQFQLQAMDVNQFKIILTQELDREDTPFHSVTVLCEDSGNPPKNASASFLVEVTDENDNPPIFDTTYYSADVTEGPGDRQALVTVRATDLDQGANAQLTYRLAPGADSDFGIYTDGSVVVTNPEGVDRENKEKGPIRELVVLAVDNGKPALTGTATVVVNIRDINDNAPAFSRPIYYFSVPEDAREDTIVSNVSATDNDLEINAIFYYKMADEDAFKIPFEVGLDGVIRVTEPLDREVVPSYDFSVIAYDLGEPVALSSTVAVHVKVQDVNDNRPVFVFPNEDNFTLYVPHTLSPNMAFGNIVADDADTGNNGKLVYARDSGNGTKYFDVSNESGQILLIRQLTTKELGLHVLAVVAHDLGAEEQKATQSILHIVVYEGNATLAHRDNGLGFRNIVVVIVLVVVTSVLALAILLTILLIKRVDKQRRLYHAKAAEAKVDSNMHHMQLASSSDVEASTSLSDVTGDSKENGKKKKEVSFSLDEDNNINSHPPLTTFNPVLPDKYDAISDRDRGKLKNDAMLSSNRYQPDHQNKSSGLKKDVNTFTFHQVHPTAGADNRQGGENSRHHEDNLSDVSGDVSTSDSGRGGSDVELQSHGGTSKDSGDTSFASQRGFNAAHNNLSLSGNTGLSKPVNLSGHSNNSNANTSARLGSGRSPHKSVHFQNIRPDPLSFGSFLSPMTSPPGSSGRPPLPPHHGASKSGGLSMPPSSTSRFAPNLLSDDDGSYVKLSNNNSNAIRNSGRRSNPSNQELERHRNRMLSDNLLPNPGSQLMGASNRDEEYMDMNSARSFASQRSNSNSCIDSADRWDGDTTTSGSYTVDPQELCDEIDKLFFDEVKDVVV